MANPACAHPTHRRTYNPTRAEASASSRLLLVKPVGTFDEPFDGLLGHVKSLRAEVVAQEIETPLDPADTGLVRVVIFCCWLSAEVTTTVR